MKRAEIDALKPLIRKLKATQRMLKSREKQLDTRYEALEEAGKLNGNLAALLDHNGNAFEWAASYLGDAIEQLESLRSRVPNQPRRPKPGPLEERPDLIKKFVRPERR